MAVDNRTGNTYITDFIEECRAKGIKIDDSDEKYFSRRLASKLKGILGDGVAFTLDNMLSNSETRMELTDWSDSIKSYLASQREKELEELKKRAEEEEAERKKKASDLSDTVGAANDAEVAIADTTPDLEPAPNPNDEKAAEPSPRETGITKALKTKEPKVKKESSGQSDNEGGNTDSPSLLSSMISNMPKEGGNSEDGIPTMTRTEIARKISQLRFQRDFVQRESKYYSAEAYSYYITQAISDTYKKNHVEYKGFSFDKPADVLKAAVILLAQELEKEGYKDYTEAIVEKLAKYNKERDKINAEIEYYEKMRNL